MSAKRLTDAALADLRAARDALANLYGEFQVAQAEFNLAKAKLDRKQRDALMAAGASPNAAFDEDTGEISPPAPKKG